MLLTINVMVIVKAKFKDTTSTIPRFRVGCTGKAKSCILAWDPTATIHIPL